MKKWLFCAIWVLLLATVVQAQKTCTRVSPTSQNCMATVSWTASAVDAMHDAPTDYIIRRGDGGGAMTEIGKVSATTTSFQNTFTDLGNTIHCWVVAAVNAGGEAVSSQVCWTTPSIVTTAPNIPGGLTLAAISSQTLRATWDDADGETSYEVWGKSAKGQGRQFVKQATLIADTTTWDWTQLKRYSSYCVQVRAATGAVYSEFTNPACATTSR